MELQLLVDPYCATQFYILHVTNIWNLTKVKSVKKKEGMFVFLSWRWWNL